MSEAALALRALRLRTPRLELRLPTDEEVEQLFAVAEAGIHPPETMPFGFPWTDDLNRDAFVEHHRAALRDWRADNWDLNLVTFLDGRPIGSQSLHREGEKPGVVATGSWLGQAYQRRGLGTEQRAAVVELAFAHLDARAVTSSAFADNHASLRVSEKLGYEVVGEDVKAPRGEPRRHLLLRLNRERWHAPFAVEVEGLDAALPSLSVA